MKLEGKAYKPFRIRVRKAERLRPGRKRANAVNREEVPTFSGAVKAVKRLPFGFEMTALQAGWREAPPQDTNRATDQTIL